MRKGLSLLVVLLGMIFAPPNIVRAGEPISCSQKLGEYAGQFTGDNVYPLNMAGNAYSEDSVYIECKQPEKIIWRQAERSAATYSYYKPVGDAYETASEAVEAVKNHIILTT